MYKIVGTDGKEYGPIAELDLRVWIKDGRVDAGTLAQRVGDTEWLPLGSMAEFSATFKPSVEETPPPLPVAQPPLDPEAFAAAVLARDFEIDIWGAISRSWELYKNNFWPVFGATLIIGIAASVSGSLPYVGVFISMALNGILYAGLYWYLLKLIRGEKAEISDAFAGFNRETTQLVLGGAVTSILPFLALSIAALPLILSIYPVILKIDTNPNMDPQILWDAVTAVGVVGLLAGILIAICIYALWVFTLPLIIDKKLPFWNAMELSRKSVMRSFGSVAALLLFSGIIGSLGIFLCCIGVYFTLPIPFLSIAYTYEDLFGSQK